jgi:hypothetical protein
MGRDSRLNPNSRDFREVSEATRRKINRDLESQWNERVDRYEDDRIHNRGPGLRPSRRRWVVVLLIVAAVLAVYALVR